MKVDKILERMDANIKLLTESLEISTLLDKHEVKERYGSVKTYDECVAMERGALTSMITFRQWIVNQTAIETHLETYEQLVDRSFRKD